MSNLYKRLLALIPNAPPQVGDVTSVDGGVATISLPGGGVVTARGDAAPGDRVFFRDSVIEGPAPNLTLEVIEE